MTALLAQNMQLIVNRILLQNKYSCVDGNFIKNTQDTKEVFFLNLLLHVPLL